MNNKPAPTSLFRQIVFDLLFALLVICCAASRFIACQVLARIANVVLLALAAILLTDAEKGEPQHNPQSA